MDRWIDYEIQRGFTDWSDLVDSHNADCDAYEATIAALSKTCTELETDREYNAGLVAERDKRIAELEAQRDMWKGCLDEEIEENKKFMERAYAAGCPDDHPIHQVFDWAMCAIDDALAELARVKAESLRVVVVGEECALVDLELSECHLFRHVTGGPAYIMDTAIKGRSYTDSGRAHWCARVEGTVKEWSQYDDFAPVQPVRLERWEDADVLGD